MTQEERNEMLRDARLISLAAPVVLPILEKRKRIALQKLISKHREGDTNTLTLISEITVLTDIESEIKQKVQIVETLGEKNAN